MSAKQMVKKSIILGIIFATFIGLIFSNASASVETDPADGVWTDDFDDDKDVTLTNCHVDNGTVKLNKAINEVPYDFADGKSHKAYSYVTPFFRNFYPPKLHIIFKNEHKLGEWTGELGKIKTRGNGAFKYSSEQGLGNYVVHHFRFKIDVDLEHIDKLDVYWYGEADNDKTIKLYCWQYFPLMKVMARWYELNRTTSKDIYANIPKDMIDLVIQDDNYIDICVVASPKSTPCTLYTDYVKLVYVTEGYSFENGFAITKEAIDPNSLPNTTSFYWDALTWNDYEIGKSKIKYQVLYNKDGNWSVVDNDYIAKNEEGLENPPISLHSMPHEKPYDKIKIKANLTTDNPSISPKISSWAVTWQTDTHMWKDLFNYNYRLEKNKVNIIDGNISIDPVTGDWPMFGQNPQNTRSSEREGPDEFKRNWWNITGSENNIILNPVIRDGALYYTYYQSNELYIIDDISILLPEGHYEIPYDEKVDLKDYDKWLNSPTITEDKIIIATQQTDPDGGTSNSVIALDKTDKSEVWEFVHPENICYSSTPVVFDNKVFVTSWGGDPDLVKTNKNNKVIALELSSGSKLWDYNLPAGSFSTPAAYNNTVFVGCNEGSGDSLFAINAENGDPIWNQSVGAIGKASPVVYKNTVFIMSKCKSLNKIKLTALNADNGTILWKKTICYSRFAPADSTPAVHNDVIYVASPTGMMYAFDINDVKNPLWDERVYQKGVLGSFLLTSPVYANGVVYIGTPAGRFHALDASNGNKKDGWRDFETHQIINGTITNVNPPVVTSAIVSNGLVFFGDNNGKIYSLGKFKEPEDQEITGSIVSIPIELPTGYWWDRFHASYNTSEHKSINSVTFSILDKNRKTIKEIRNRGTITMENRTLDRTIRLRADLYAKNVSVNPELFNWGVTFQEDGEYPFIKRGTFSPDTEGWLNEIVPVFSVKVQDNITGLLVSSAQYVLEYSKGQGVEAKTLNTHCSGKNGTTDIETIIANISKLGFYQNITDLYSISISISDLAGNEASLTFDLHMDNVKPISSINTQGIQERYNSLYENIRISATARDPGTPEVNSSGILRVGLYYRFSHTRDFSGDWILFGKKDLPSPFWGFTANEDGGYYELSTRAEDVAGNVEDEKESGDVSFLFDPKPPTIPRFTKPLWYKSLPMFSIKFTDDFRLDTIEYRPNFETEWKIIDTDINKTTYESSWTLQTEYWDQMEEGEEYYLYFKVSDSVGNINITGDIDRALTIIKDVSKPKVEIDIPEIEAEWTWDDTFDISVYADDRNGSNIEMVELWYRYSEDNVTWSNWSKYKDEDTSAPIVDTEWEFHAKDGNGYYEFYIKAEDAAGNVADSAVFSTGVNIFPLIYVAAMVSLIVVVVLLTIILFILWRKKRA
ncbi:MAG: PQQ-binding-like beta-propeller repeat protein [Thermoplasmatales archaeon]|nr:MAG: PQQ-binding-like beta-propeller repeat protein [Thermoplasmatales archaeon]